MHSPPALALLYIDRWTLPSKNEEVSTVARTGLALLPEVTSITIELLDSLNIQIFSVAAHSAGVYQMLDLVKQCSDHGRVKKVFPISTHIPAPLLSSTVMNMMSKVPDFMFSGITHLDSVIAEFYLGRLSKRLFATEKSTKEDKDVFVDLEDLRDLLAECKPSTEHIDLTKK